MKFSLTFLLLFFFMVVRAYSSNPKSCIEENQWAQTSSRTQGGGYIWYPGFGKSDTIEKARILAEGEAIRKLNTECGFPHKEIRIIERCEEQVGDLHQTYLRLSLKDEHCKQARYASSQEKESLLNTGLVETYEQYKYLLEKKLNLSAQDCSRSSATECYKRGKYEYYLGNTNVALEYFEQGCKKDDINSCFNAGIVSSKNGDKEKSRGFYQFACDLGDGESCHKVSISYIDQKNFTAALKFAQSGCNHNLGKSCYNQAMLMKKINKVDEKAIELALSKACQLSIKQACKSVNE